MSAHSEQSARELFRPRSDWSPAVVCAYLLLFACLAREIVPLLLVGAIIGFSVIAWGDLRTAIWLCRCDPHRGRGRACFWFCLSRGTLKIVVAATSLAVIVWNPLGWHGAIAWEIPAALYAGMAAHVGFAILGRRAAEYSGVRIWIDSGLNRSRRQHLWPSRCRGTTNEAGGLWLTAAACFVVVFVLGLESLAYVRGNAELPMGCALIAVMVGGIVWSRKIAAATPEECWYLREADAATDRELIERPV